MILGDHADAQDATQEVFVRVIKALARFRGDSSPMTWLYRISTNHCLNVIRSQKRRQKRLEKNAQSPNSVITPEDQLENITTIRRLLPRFDNKSQQIAIYFFIDQMHLTEVAEQMNLSVPTIRKYLRRFVEKSKYYLNS